MRWLMLKTKLSIYFIAIFALIGCCPHDEALDALYRSNNQIGYRFSDNDMRAIFAFYPCKDRGFAMDFNKLCFDLIRTRTSYFYEIHESNIDLSKVLIMSASQVDFYAYTETNHWNNNRISSEWGIIRDRLVDLGIQKDDEVLLIIDEQLRMYGK
jgi:hypothetical protein